MIESKSFSKAEIQIAGGMSLLKNRGRIAVAWFPGVQMYEVLKAAAKRGIEDVRRLLVMAGNDSKVIITCTSLSSLFSELRMDDAIGNHAVIF